MIELIDNQLKHIQENGIEVLNGSGENEVLSILKYTLSKNTDGIYILSVDYITKSLPSIMLGVADKILLGLGGNVIFHNQKHQEEVLRSRGINSVGNAIAAISLYGRGMAEKNNKPTGDKQKTELQFSIEHEDEIKKLMTPKRSIFEKVLKKNNGIKCVPYELLENFTHTINNKEWEHCFDTLPEAMKPITEHIEIPKYFGF